MLVNRTWNKLLSLLLLVPLIVTGLVLGVFFFAVALAVISVFLAVLFLRLWWLRRKFRRFVQDPVIEGEFEIIRTGQRLRGPDRAP